MAMYPRTEIRWLYERRLSAAMVLSCKATSHTGLLATEEPNNTTYLGRCLDHESFEVGP